MEERATSFEEVAPDAEAMAALMAALAPTHPWLVDEREGRVAGYAYASPHRSRAACRWAVDVAVYVHPGHRRAGAGRGLSAVLLDRLRAQGLRTAHAGIALPNDASVGLHEAMGFTPTGVSRNIGFKLGAWRDVGWWQLDLRPGDDAPPGEPLPPAS